MCRCSLPEWAASAPFLFFTDHQDPALAEAVREGRRDEFAAYGRAEEEVPDPQAPETFERSRLDWGERTAPSHARILEWHRRLIGLRRELPQLAAGTWPDVAFDSAKGWLRVQRNGTLLVANLAAQPARVSLPGGGARWCLEVASSEQIIEPADAQEAILLPAMSAALLIER